MKRAIAALLFLALAACGDEAAPDEDAPPATASVPAVVPPPPPARPAASPAFDQNALNPRCMAVATRKDTDPAVVAADKRICDCLERTLKPADFNTLLSFMEIDSERPDYNARVAELYQSYGMTENQFATEIGRVRAAGRDCRR